MKKRSGCLIVLGLLICLVAALFLVTFISQKPVKNTVVEIKISSRMAEERLTDFPERLLQGPVTTVKEVLDILKLAASDSKASGVILKIAPFDMGLAKVQELRDAIEDFKRSGKFIFSYLEYGGNIEYYLACAADKLYLMPQGNINLTGIKSEVYFYKGIFDKLDISADFEHIGKYKSAPEVLTRKEMSPAHREAVNSILDSYYEQFIAGIASIRKLSKSQVRNIIDQGIFLAEEALSQGLVDKLVYEDEFYDLVKKQNKGKLPIIQGRKYLPQAFWLPGAQFKPKIALIYACGTIVSGSSSYNPLTGMLMGSETIAAAIKRARESSSIKAIIFRIDSPGGSAIASDVIWRELILTKGKKPFIVSMSDVAGSGGYWIAMAADKIVAQPGTLTGSIGVFAGKFNLKGLYQKLGISKEIISRGKHAEFYSDYRNFTEEEKEILLKGIENTYHKFVSKVAQGRKLSYEQVEEIAQGRVWTGEQGKKLGLVDQLGGMDKAISLAKKAAGISPKIDVALVVYPKAKTWTGLLFGSAFLSRINPIKQIDPAVRLAAQLQQLNRERFFLIMPYYLKFK